MQFLKKKLEGLCVNSLDFCAVFFKDSNYIGIDLFERILKK